MDGGVERVQYTIPYRPREAFRPLHASKKRWGFAGRPLAIKTEQ